MKFKAVRKEAVILDPAREMQPRTIPVEVRSDPLTGRTARICHFMRLQWKKPDLDQLIAGTEANCPFCPDKVLKATPCFPPDIAPEGRFFRDDKVLFPNLAPYDGLGAVATLGSPHYIPMTAIEPERIAGGISLALDFFRRLQALKHPESVYHLISWNYMPASGSSLIHPHLQVFATATAPNQLRQELKAAESYWESHRRTYWDDLVVAEKAEGLRYLGEIGRVAWLAAYAPFGVAGDVVGVVGGCRSTLELTATDIVDIARGLTRAMAAYDAMGLYNFNVCFFPGTEKDAHARLHLVFSPRTYFNPALGTPDAAALRSLYNESVCMAFPEEIAERIRKQFE
jgi:galactose-1-phosphate uridylyltransferase